MSSHNVSGAVVNKDQEHWVALRVVDGNLWRLDSAVGACVLSVDDTLQFLRRYPNAFLVEYLQD